MISKSNATLTHLGVIALALKIMLAKRKDYGNADPFANIRACEVFGVDPIIGALIRESDKNTRIANILRNGGPAVVSESLLDTVVDKINYVGIEAGLLAERDEAVMALLVVAAYELPSIIDAMIAGTNRVVVRESGVSVESGLVTEGKYVQL